MNPNVFRKIMMEANQPKKIYRARIYDDRNKKSKKCDKYFCKEEDAYRWLYTEYCRSASIPTSTDHLYARATSDGEYHSKLNDIKGDDTLDRDSKIKKIFENIIKEELEKSSYAEVYFLIYFQLLEIEIS